MVIGEEWAEVDAKKCLPCHIMFPFTVPGKDWLPVNHDYVFHIFLKANAHKKTRYTGLVIVWKVIVPLSKFKTNFCKPYSTRLLIPYQCTTSRHTDGTTNTGSHLHSWPHNINILSKQAFPDPILHLSQMPVPHRRHRIDYSPLLYLNTVQTIV